MITDETSGGSGQYEIVVVGGGPGGLTTALYTTRLGHETALIDRGGGRAAMMQDTHNVVGVPESVSGTEFLQTAFEQLETHGTDVVRDLVTDLDRAEGDEKFGLETANGVAYEAQRVVLATGFTDEQPDPPLPRTGRGLHYCLHCDADLFVDESVYVMGHGDSAAKVAMIMLNYADEVDLLLDGDEPTWTGATERQLRAHPVDVIPEEVVGVNNGDDGWLESLAFGDETVREYKGGFAMYGSDYNTDLAEQAGADVNDDGTVPVDDHGNTSVDGLYAVGDLTPGHNQIPVALGEGAKAGIDLHYALREFPKSVEELDAAASATTSAESELPGDD